MEKRKHAKDFLLACLGLGGPQVDLGRVGVKIGVGETRGLGEAGGAAGELEDRDVVVWIDGNQFRGAVVVSQPVKGVVAVVFGNVGYFPALEKPE